MSCPILGSLWCEAPSLTRSSGHGITTFDDRSQLRGAGPVREYLLALHENMVDARTRRLIFAESAAYLEGDCAAASTGGINRIAYCVAYDVTGDKISAMRCYGAIAHLAP